LRDQWAPDAHNSLITGGAGFIGANLVKYLTEKYPEDRIVVLDILTYAGSVETSRTTCCKGVTRRRAFSTATYATRR